MFATLEHIVKYMHTQIYHKLNVFKKGAGGVLRWGPHEPLGKCSWLKGTFNNQDPLTSE